MKNFGCIQPDLHTMLTKHRIEKSHNFEFDNTKILCREKYYNKIMEKDDQHTPTQHSKQTHTEKTSVFFLQKKSVFWSNSVFKEDSCFYRAVI